MSKSRLKDTRAPNGQQSESNETTDQPKFRPESGPILKMDASRYQRMPEYEGKTLFWAATNGEAESWLALGAEPVPRVNQGGKVYKGINDRSNSEYVMVSSVSVEDGVSIDNFLLFLPDDEYQRLRILPKEQRNEEIQSAMGMGKADSEARVMSHVKGLRTYAPKVDGNETGLKISHGEETFEA